MSTVHPFDYSAEKPTITNEKARELHDMVVQLRAAQGEVDDAEARLEAAEARLRYIREVQIPEALNALGTEVYRIPGDGTEIKLEDDVFASISEANEDDAFDWLERNNEGGMIKRTVVIAFNKDQEEEATRLLEELRPKYAGVKQERGVHHSTLRAWAKRRHEEKLEIPPCITSETKTVAKVKGVAGTPRKYKKK